MNFLNSLYTQARDLFMSLTPQARLMAVLMTGVILVSLAFLVQGATKTSMEYAFSGYVFSEEEARKAEVALSNAKLNNFEFDHSRLKIPKSLKDTYIKALGESGVLPVNLGSHSAKALLSGNFLDGPSIQKERIRNGKIADLQTAIKLIPGVRDALVSYDEAKEGFAQPMKRVATVWVFPEHKRALGQKSLSHIAKMVQGQFAGLDYKDVKVMDGTSQEILVGETDPSVSDQGKQMYLKQQQELEIKNKAANLLSMYEDVKIEVGIDLEPIREATEQTSYAEKPPVVNSLVTTKSVDTAKPARSGQPGAAANGATSIQPSPNSTAMESVSKVKETTESKKTIPGFKRSLSEKEGYKINDARIAVNIPNNLYEKIWRNRNPVAADGSNKDTKPDAVAIDSIRTQIFEDIKKLLTPLLPIEPIGDDPYARVTVTDFVPEPPIEIPTESLASAAMAWAINSWQTVALIGLALFAIVALRSAVANQGKPKDEEFARGFGVSLDEAIAGGDLEGLMSGVEADEEESGEVNENSAGRRFNLTGEKVKEDLSQIVRENPGVAVNILRSWIADAA